MRSMLLSVARPTAWTRSQVRPHSVQAAVQQPCSVTGGCHCLPPGPLHCHLHRLTPQHLQPLTAGQCTSPYQWCLQLFGRRGRWPRTSWTDLISRRLACPQCQWDRYLFSAAVTQPPHTWNLPSCNSWQLRSRPTSKGTIHQILKQRQGGMCSIEWSRDPWRHVTQKS